MKWIIRNVRTASLTCDVRQQFATDAFMTSNHSRANIKQTKKQTKKNEEQKQANKIQNISKICKHGSLESAHD